MARDTTVTGKGFDRSHLGYDREHGIPQRGTLGGVRPGVGDEWLRSTRRYDEGRGVGKYRNASQNDSTVEYDVADMWMLEIIVASLYRICMIVAV